MFAGGFVKDKNMEEYEKKLLLPQTLICSNLPQSIFYTSKLDSCLLLRNIFYYFYILVTNYN